MIRRLVEQLTGISFMFKLLKDAKFGDSAELMPPGGNLEVPVTKHL